MKHIILLVILFGNVCFSGAQERPVIGLSDIYRNGGSSVPRSYVDAVLSVDGIPVIVPLMYEEDKIVELLKSLDGIIFTGGEDFAPSYYNETPIPHVNKINASRDMFDIKLLHLAVEHGIPVLGICRGLQLINIAYGGSLYQDLEIQYPDKSIRHRQTLPKEEPSHAVIVEDDAVFAGIVGERVLMVNSSHHQAIKKLAKGFRVAGTSPDKVVEVIEKVDSAHWIVGVQFHPEVMVDNSLSMRRIFKSFVGEAARLKSKKQQTLYANIIATPEAGTSVANDELYTTDTNIDVSYDDNKREKPDNSMRDIHVPDNREIDYVDDKTAIINMQTTEERRRHEMKTFKEKGRQHDKEQKEQEKLDKQAQKEKERQEKEDFKKWMQERKIAEKEQEQQEKIAEKEQKAKDEAAKKEAAEKEKQRQKELKEKSEKEKQARKEQEQQKKIADKEQKAKEKAAKKEAAEKEKQRQKEQKKRAKLDKKELKKMEKQKKEEKEKAS
ncbi:MAG: gamma-glutamyl-gamma-aminobutyrate hydrolase family protein [Tannerella sp.]|jgi:gamma-glutamyl-gamma-aminobutyrate hydrolase PuuD|nr:gamma-glutamyl-gamma-aminobutyrate hydrolase family protein [Tannerella sp.]